MLVCWPCSRRLGPVDRCIGHLTEVGWPVQWSVGLGCRGRGWRRAAFLAPVWGVGVVRGTGRRGSVACGVAQRALLSAFMFVFMSFLYFRSYFRCILAFFVFVCLCAAVYGVIKNNNNKGPFGEACIRGDRTIGQDENNNMAVIEN